MAQLIHYWCAALREFPFVYIESVAHHPVGPGEQVNSVLRGFTDHLPQTAGWFCGGGIVGKHVRGLEANKSTFDQLNI